MARPTLHYKPFYTVDDVIEAACERVSPKLADELREVRRLIDPKAAKSFARKREVYSWCMYAEIIGNESKAGQIIADAYATEDGEGIDAASITREIQRHKPRSARYDKKVTFCRR